MRNTDSEKLFRLRDRAQRAYSETQRIEQAFFSCRPLSSAGEGVPVLTKEVVTQLQIARAAIYKVSLALETLGQIPVDSDKGKIGD